MWYLVLQLKILKSSMFLTLVLAVVATGCASGPRGFPPVGGIANFDRVNPHLYRGAQPNNLGLRYVHSLGVGTVVNLRRPDEAWVAEEEETRALGMEYFNVPMGGVRAPSVGEVRKVLSIIDSSPSPVFVHCAHGCDRTGVVVACYRMHHDGWKTGKALAEARSFGMSRREILMKRLVIEFEKSSTMDGKRQ
jgi:protein tyrosine/serine phosphatase